MTPTMNRVAMAGKIYLNGREPVVIKAATCRRAPDEGLILWGYRPHNGGVWAFKLVGPGRVESLGCGFEYRPAYAEVKRYLNEPMYHFEAGALLGHHFPKWTWPVCDHASCHPKP